MRGEGGARGLDQGEVGGGDLRAGRGGLDLAATLQAGRPVAQKGLLAEADGGVVVLAMAERIEPGTAARLCAVLDERVVMLQRDGIKGATDLEIHDTVLIAAAFSMYNRYVDGLGTWQPRDPDMYAQMGHHLAAEGYIAPSIRQPLQTA